MIAASKFTWTGTRGVAEASDLGDCWIRAYPDACDEGIDLVSDRTGRVVRFVVVKTDARDGEILSWTLRPLGGAVSSALELVVLND